MADANIVSTTPVYPHTHTHAQPSVIAELRVSPEIAAAAALGHRALRVPREPHARVVEVQDVIAAEAKGGEAAGGGLVAVVAVTIAAIAVDVPVLPAAGDVVGVVGARDADDLEADDAAGEVPAAVGAADAGVDAGGEEGVAGLHGGGGGGDRRQGRGGGGGGRRGRGGRRRLALGGVVGQVGLGVAVDAAEGDLAGRGLEGGDAGALGAAGGLDVEAGAVEEELVALEVGAVGPAPGDAAHVVDVAGGADGEDERRRLHVVVALDVAGQDVDEGVGYARQHDALDVALGHGARRLLLEPRRQLVVAEVAHGDKGPVRQGQGLLVGDGRPVARRDEGGYGLEVGIRPGSDDVVDIQLLLLKVLAPFVDELQG